MVLFCIVSAVINVIFRSPNVVNKGLLLYFLSGQNTLWSHDENVYVVVTKPQTA